MPDPHVLYVVTAVVVLCLAAWVAFVLLRAPTWPAPPASSAGGSAPSDVDAPPPKA